MRWILVKGAATCFPRVGQLSGSEWRRWCSVDLDMASASRVIDVGKGLCCYADAARQPWRWRAEIERRRHLEEMVWPHLGIYDAGFPGVR